MNSKTKTVTSAKSKNAKVKSSRTFSFETNPYKYNESYSVDDYLKITREYNKWMAKLTANTAKLLMAKFKKEQVKMIPGCEFAYFYNATRMFNSPEAVVQMLFSKIQTSIKLTAEINRAIDSNIGV